MGRGVSNSAAVFDMVDNPELGLLWITLFISAISRPWSVDKLIALRILSQYDNFFGSLRC